MNDEIVNKSSILDITKELIVLYNSNDYQEDLLKIMKQLFFGQSTALYYFDKSLFNEKIEAWQYGPVVSTVYSTWRTNLNTLLDTSNRNISNFEKFILDMVFDITKDYSPFDLANITHVDNGAWKQVFIPNYNVIIPNSLIKSCFEVHREILDKADNYIKEHSKYDETLLDAKIKDLSFLND